MKVKEFLIKHPELDDYTLHIISDMGYKEYKSCSYYIMSTNKDLSPKYVNASLQLDLLDENNSFVIVFCRYEDL